MNAEHHPESAIVEPGEPKLPWLRPVIEHVNLASSKAGDVIFLFGEGITSSVS